MGRGEGLSGSGPAGFAAAFLRFARWRAAAAAALIVAGALLEGMGLLLLVPVLQVVTGPGLGRGGALLAPLAGVLDPLGQTQKLLLLLACFGVLTAARAATLAARDRTLNRLQLAFTEAVRARLVARLSGAAWPAVARLSHARLVQALSVEVLQVGVASSNALVGAAAAVMLIGHCLLALLLAPIAGPVAIGFAALGAVASRPYLRRARRLGRSITEGYFGMTEAAMAFLAGLKLAAAQGQTAAFVVQDRAAADAAMADRLEFLTGQSQLRNLTSVLAGAVAAATLLAGVAVFHLAPSVLIALLLVLSRMIAPALMLQQAAQQMLHSLPSYGAVRALEAELGEAPPPSAAARRRPGPAAGGPIVLERVRFAHAGPDGRGAALKDVSLAIPEGAFVGVSGPSGAGKTTFLDLVAGVLLPDGGRILARGRELAGAALDEHRAGLAYVGQEPVLFDASVRRNLCWSRQDGSEAEIWRALELVGAADLVHSLDGGLEARIGDRGVLVSAGERQRLALARAILRRPRLLLLDEATNALDLAAEAAILDALAALRPRPTILLAAHRPESLRRCELLLQFPGPRMIPLGRAHSAA